MKLTLNETTLRGTSICPGIAIGIPYFFAVHENVVTERQIEADQISNEITHYRSALERSKKDIKHLQTQMEKENAIEACSILDTHLQIIDDPLLTTEVEAEIRRQKKNVDFVFSNLISMHEKKFEDMVDPFFRERVRDLKDVARRVMGHLLEVKRVSLSDIPANSIVFAHDLAASDVAEAKLGYVDALVTNLGGETSHAAIVSKAKGIPYIANVHYASLEQMKESLVIVDSRTGDVIINPSEKTLIHYQQLQKQLKEHFNLLEKHSKLEAETFDGYKMRLSANIDMLSELDMIHQYGGSGVGLFRSEYIFLSKQQFPSEEEQFVIYRRLVEKMKGLPIVIRTFDVGGDKLTAEQKQASHEGNPYLGCRAIRFLLKEKKIFKTQLRAILRASAYGDVSIMFPMVSGLPELLEAKAIVEESKQELSLGEKRRIGRIRIGCMIEVPSAAILSDLLGKECDFLSIGTNDLVQYSLAADRSNQAMSMVYTPTHPSVIRLIKLVVSQANQCGIPVTICGEVAADPRFTPLLMGLGVAELSVASRYLPLVKNAIRNTSIVAATQLAEKALGLSTPTEIQDLLTLEYQKNVPQDFFYNC